MSLDPFIGALSLATLTLLASPGEAPLPPAAPPPDAPAAPPPDAPAPPAAEPTPPPAAVAAAPPATPAASPEPVASEPIVDASPAPSGGEGRADRPGVFASFAAGPGLFRATSGREPDLRRFSGTTLSLEGLLAGQPSRNVAFGGQLSYNRVYGLSAEDARIDGDEPSMDTVTFSLWSLGVFLDWHPSVFRGAHGRVELAIATVEISRPASSDLDDPSGWSFGVAAGYDFTLADQVMLGPLLRLTIAPLSVDEGSGDIDVDVLSPALLLAVTYR